ncbi:hypothetical protein Sjap_003201 [Stephania japonica]|uniref:SAM-dependent methyltransferase TRM5/TYW2-type domain-containing protein n=1 Tax=Stephania japonica TaxID=461633 RepID=A0AAP0KNA1_9MAGN
MSSSSSFEKRKAAAMAAMALASTDKSRKGSIDTPIIPLLDSLNAHPSFFSTSSCSGRISILSTPTPTTTNTPNKKARGGTWLFISHSPADPTSVTDLLFPTHDPPQPQPTPGADLTFRFEPFILAVECRDLDSAQRLVSMAVASGFRESGISSASKRVIVGIRCSIRLEVPLGRVGGVLVSEEYVRVLVGIANEKMELNRRRTEGFREVLERGLVGSGVLGEYNCGGDCFHEDGVVDSVRFAIREGDVDVEEAEVDSHLGKAKCGFSYITSIGDAGDAEAVPFFSQYVCVICFLISCEAYALCLSVDSQCHMGNLSGLGAHDCSISVSKLVTIGEQVEKIFLWGHSVSILDDKHHSKALIFGGFGGFGRHARRNYTMLLDTQSGLLEAANFESSPSPRMGHTSSVVGALVFVIGGRGAPLKILNDVWMLDVDKNEWRLLECAGSVFPPRHRHAAAVAGSKIFIFGGLNNETIFASMHVLDTENSRWSEVTVLGEWPSARHSHAMVSNGSQLFMFGGYDGDKALDDIYSFDIRTCLWKKETAVGRIPRARFSHSMFIYKNYLGIIGGCPIRQHYQELALLDMQSGIWKHVMLNSAISYLFIRSSANVVGDDLVMIGGGAACYAFGAKFSEPMKMNLLPLLSTNALLASSGMMNKHGTHKAEGHSKDTDDSMLGLRESSEALTESSNLDEMLDGIPELSGRKCWVLQLERKHAKKGKDILKKFEWLDLGRKVYSCESGTHISLPVTGKFYVIFHKNELDRNQEFLGVNNHPQEPLVAEKPSIEDISSQTALNHLFSFGGSFRTDEVAYVRNSPKSPHMVMSEAVCSLIKKWGLPTNLIEQIPTRWERLGDIVVLPATSFKDPAWASIENELWPAIAKSLRTCRLARQGRIAPTGTRDSTLEVLVGDNGWVHHRENGIFYSFDATKCMFSWGNLSEKLRMALLDCGDEVIVDLFAGIGYFVLPFLVGAKAKLVYACEWNSHAVDALRHNIQANSVADRCVILEGDNRVVAPKGVAHRVCLGLLPSSQNSWLTAVRALRIEGGMLHVHENVKDSEEASWSKHVAKSIHDIAKSEGFCWEVSVEHVERVKWYGPRIRHLVADVRCKQLQI